MSFQLYLLTVLTTVLAGLALAGEFLSERYTRFSEYTGFMANTVYRLILGIVTLLIGFINFFVTYPGDIAVLGELFPSLVGLVAGVLLLTEFVSSRRNEKEGSKAAELADRVERISGPYLTIVGIASVFIGILHAVLPEVPFF